MPANASDTRHRAGAGRPPMVQSHAQPWVGAAWAHLRAFRGRVQCQGATWLSFKAFFRSKSSNLSYWRDLGTPCLFLRGNRSPEWRSDMCQATQLPGGRADACTSSTALFFLPSTPARENNEQVQLAGHSVDPRTQQADWVVLPQHSPCFPVSWQKASASYLLP